MNASCARSISFLLIAFVLLGVLGSSVRGQAYHGQVPPTRAPSADTQDNVGAVNVAVTAIPWDDVAAAMNASANFTIKPEDAVTKVQTASGNFSSKDLDALYAVFKAGYGLGSSSLGTLASNATPNTNPAVNNTTLTANAANISLTSITPEDPRTAYGQAAGFLQWLAALNSSVQHVTEDGYKAYLAILNINFSPYKSGANVNLFSTISFFSYQQMTPMDQLPVVMPLLATDDLELINVDQGGQRTRVGEANFGGVLSSALALNADVQGNHTSTQDYTGGELNSLITSTPFERNSYLVRFGAARGANGLIMVPQFHAVPVLLLVPDGATPPTVHWVSKTQMRDATTGARIEARTSSSVHSKVLEVVRTFPPLLPAAPLEERILESLGKADPLNIPAGSLLDDLGAGNFPQFKTDLTALAILSEMDDATVSLSDLQPLAAAALARDDTKTKTDLDLLAAKMKMSNPDGGTNPAIDLVRIKAKIGLINQVCEKIWTGLAAQVVLGSSYSSGEVQFPQSPVPGFPPAQSVLLSDNGTATSVSLFGGANLPATGWLANITLNATDANSLLNGKTIPAQNVTSDGKTIQLTFPSLVSLAQYLAAPSTPLSKAAVLVIDPDKSSLNLSLVGQGADGKQTISVTGPFKITLLVNSAVPMPVGAATSGNPAPAPAGTTATNK